jgi:hypothetical protein
MFYCVPQIPIYSPFDRHDLLLLWGYYKETEINQCTQIFI